MLRILRYWFRGHNENELSIKTHYDSSGEVRKIKLVFRMGYLTHRSTLYRDNLDDLSIYMDFFKTTYRENGYWVRKYNCYDGQTMEISSEQFIC